MDMLCGVICRAKTKSSICLIYKKIDTVFWLCKAFWLCRQWRGDVKPSLSFYCSRRQIYAARGCITFALRLYSPDLHVIIIITIPSKGTIPISQSQRGTSALDPASTPPLPHPTCLTLAPVACFSHRLTPYKIVGHFFGRSYLRLALE